MSEKKQTREFADTVLAAAAVVGHGGVRRAAPLPARTEEPAVQDLVEDLRAANEARIVKLRRQYKDGSYSVDAKKLAAKIVDEHLS